MIRWIREMYASIAGAFRTGADQGRRDYDEWVGR